MGTTIESGESDALRPSNDVLLQAQLAMAQRQIENNANDSGESDNIDKTGAVIQLALQANKLHAEIIKLQAETDNLRRQSRSENLRFLNFH